MKPKKRNHKLKTIYITNLREIDQLLASFILKGQPVLAVTRYPTKYMIKNGTTVDITHYWFTTIESDNVISPLAFTKIYDIFKEFAITHDKFIFVLEGIEYLSLNFRRKFKTSQILDKLAEMAESYSIPIYVLFMRPLV